jgi:hypothetical protein
MFAIPIFGEAKVKENGHRANVSLKNRNQELILNIEF